MIKLTRILEETNLYETLTYSMSIGGALANLNRLWNYNAVEYIADPSQKNSIKAIFHHPINEKQFNSLLKNIDDLLGYFPSYIVTKDVKNNRKYEYEYAIQLLNNNEYFGIYFDAKYDRRLDESQIPNKLYHISPSIFDTKILDIGLAPKTKNKLSTHPSRIYCAFSKKSAISLLNSDKFTGEHKQFTLFEIDYEKIKEYREIRFMEDPQYENVACYTYENIPPQYIKVVERVNL